VLPKSETGSGKTRIALHQIKLWIDHRKKAQRPHRVIYQVPAHKLGSQILEAARAAGMNAAVFEGRDRKCKNTEAVDLARTFTKLSAAAAGKAPSNAHSGPPAPVTDISPA
jgi:hypothetical protein